MLPDQLGHLKLWAYRMTNAVVFLESAGFASKRTRKDACQKKTQWHKQTNNAFISLSLWQGPSLALSGRRAATQHEPCSSPQYESHPGFRFSWHPPLSSQARFCRPYSREVTSRPFAALLLSFSIEKWLTSRCGYGSEKTAGGVLKRSFRLLLLAAPP